MVDDEPYTVGQLVYATSGEYSSYGVLAIARVVKPFLVQDFTQKKFGDIHVDYQRLVREGYLEDLTARELYTGGN